jgi:hypothetical protein
MDCGWYQPVPYADKQHHASEQLQVSKNLLIHLRSHQHIKTMYIELAITYNINQFHRI